MRLSCIEGDPGFAAYKQSIRDRLNVYIFVDDVPQMYCLTADEERGEVTRYRRAEGGFVVAPDGVNLETETVLGRVHIDRVAVIQ